MANDAPWYSTLGAEEQSHIQTKGWDKDDLATAAAKAIKAHQQAEKLIGAPSDSIMRLPKDAADPAYQSALDRLLGYVVPKEAADYKFDGLKFKDGADLDEADAQFVRDLAVKHKLTPAAAQGLAAALIERADAAEANSGTDNAVRVGANAATLRAAWGAEFDVKSYAATRAMEAAGFPKALLEAIAQASPEDYVASMNAAVALGYKMGEANMHRGTGTQTPGGNPTAGMTVDQASARWSQVMADPVLRGKFLAGDATLVAEWKDLTAIMASGRVPRQ